jgi:hypothetical protein
LIKWGLNPVNALMVEGRILEASFSKLSVEDLITQTNCFPETVKNKTNGEDNNDLE